MSRNVEFFLLCCGLAVAAVCRAQSPETSPHPALPTPAISSRHPARTAKGHRLVANKPTAGINPSAAVTPANVILKDGKLTVEANNSDLGQILKEVANSSGMTIDSLGSSGQGVALNNSRDILDGLNHSSRVFGVYGPGNPHDVLTDLLTGSHYNFMMIGDTAGGTPRELLLSDKSDAPAPAPSATAGAAHTQEDNDEAPEEEPPGPGAIIHVPPAPSDDTDTRVQQQLQRLQQMHNQQQQQQPQQDQNGPQ
jgi:hypothetical protein